MSKAIFFLFVITAVSASSCSSPRKQKVPYASTQEGQELVLHETSFRSIEGTGGIVYCVEKDLRNLSAYKAGNLLWRVDIIAACGTPGVGRPEIRSIGVDQDTIWVTYGKHSYAVVNRNTGKAAFWGAD